MKTSLHTVRILLVGLLAVVIISCGPDEDVIPAEDVTKTEQETLTFEEKLAGEYELIYSEIDHVDDKWDLVDEPSDFEATMILTHGGSVVTSGVHYGNEFSYIDTWSATATTITIGDDTDSYTLQGTTLTIMSESDLQISIRKWKKIK